MKFGRVKMNDFKPHWFLKDGIIHYSDTNGDMWIPTPEQLVKQLNNYLDTINKLKEINYEEN